MSFDTLQFLDTVNPGPPDGEGRTVAQVFARAAAAERQSEAAEQAEAEARRAAALDRAETLAIQNRALGDPMGEISRAQTVAAQARDDIADLEAKLERAHKRLAQAQDNVNFYAARMQAANDCAQRSVTGGPDLLGPAKAAHREYVQASRAAWSVATTGAPRARRPFAGGVASRSEHCIWCTANNVSDHESYLLHSDPEFNVPVTTAEQAKQAEQAESGVSAQAERRTHRRYAEISR